MPGFFGLNQNSRKKVFQEIFDLTYHGNGGFPHSEVYNMPTWMRRAYINNINDFNTQQQKEIDRRQMQNQDVQPRSKEVFKPNISPKS